MSTELIEAVKELNETFHQFKEANDLRLKEIEKNGSAPAELEAQVKQMAEAMASLETKLNRPAFDKPGAEKQAPESEQAKAFETWLRRGEKGLTPDSAKLLSAGDDTQGGYLAPVQLVQQIIKDVTEYSPVRSVAWVIPTAAKAIELPRRKSKPTAQWIGKSGTVDTSATNSNYGIEKIAADEMVAVTDVTWSLLEDSGFNLAQFIQEDMAEQFGAAEGEAFILGSGQDEPRGLLNAGDLIERASGDAAKLTADSLIALTFAVKSLYANNGTFALNRNTLFSVYTLKDGQGQYLYRPNQEVGRAPTIQGRPYIECPDMPDVAAGTYPIVYGDFRRGYVIADRQAVSVLRDDFSQSSKRVVRFVGSKRTGGQVVLPEAFAKLKIAASL